MNDAEEVFSTCRARLQGLAYRMLGTRADAEDILQDAYLRFKETDRSAIRNAEAFLVTVVTRLCLDQLKSARARREVYVGAWLPEPILGIEEPPQEIAIQLAEDLSFALLMTLEKLSAPERAAFLLHDVFDTSYADIAEALGRSEAACRQLTARARKAVRGARPDKPATPEAHKALLAKFVEATATGDPGKLEALLTADAVAYTDGGGIKIAALNPIKGAEKVARFFTGLVRKHEAQGGTREFVLATINGAPGYVIFVDGAMDQTLSIDVEDDRIAAFYIVRNPEKLREITGAFS